MTEHVTRRQVAPRKRRAELKRLRAKVAEQEERLNRLRWATAARIDRLAARVSVLERWCPFLPPRAGAGDPGDALPGGEPGPVAELTDDTR